MGSPSSSTLKALGAVCGNVCAFPGCIAPIYDTLYNVLVGEVCHIEANSEYGPRYRKEQLEEERQGFANLVFMCQPHHTIIDDQSRMGEFTVGVLKQMKRDHEERSHNTIPTEDLLERLVRKILDLQVLSRPLPQLVVVVESFVSQGQHPSIDTYDFRIKLKNEGSSTIRDYRIEVEIPWAHATSTSIYPAEVKDHRRGQVRLFRFTEDGHPGFVLYPGDTSEHLISLDYTVSVEQYRTIRTESIKVLLYSDDVLLSNRDYPLTNYLDENRLDQVLGA